MQRELYVIVCSLIEEREQPRERCFPERKKKGQMTIPKSSQRRLNTQREIINHFARLLPSFNDLFDEQSWYIFFACLTVCSFLIAFILSRYVKLSDGGREKRTHPFVNVRRTRLFQMRFCACVCVCFCFLMLCKFSLFLL